jgi:hypothetical protein
MHRAAFRKTDLCPSFSSTELLPPLLIGDSGACHRCLEQRPDSKELFLSESI